MSRRERRGPRPGPRSRSGRATVAGTHYPARARAGYIAGMLCVLKHVLIEYGPDRDAHIDAAVRTILETFPEASLDVAQGLLDDDLLIEARIPLRRVQEWPAVSRRAHAVQFAARLASEPASSIPTDMEPSGSFHGPAAEPGMP